MAGIVFGWFIIMFVEHTKIKLQRYSFEGTATLPLFNGTKPKRVRFQRCVYYYTRIVYTARIVRILGFCW